MHAENVSPTFAFKLEAFVSVHMEQIMLLLQRAILPRFLPALLSSY
jgi:hypothetical protein